MACLAHVTNTMAVDGDVFEKGPDHGVAATLAVVQAAAGRSTPSAGIGPPS